jgi:hypothetical protein
MDTRSSPRRLRSDAGGGAGALRRGPRQPHRPERRAIEAFVWGMPAVNAELMFEAIRDAKADFNHVVYWSRAVTCKNQTLTPNPDTILRAISGKRSGPTGNRTPVCDVRGRRPNR